MNILYLVPFWPYLYTPWLFREIAWMRQRGHGTAVVSLGPPPGNGASADLADFELDDLPVLQLRPRYTDDAALLGSLGALVGRAAFRKPLGGLAAEIKDGGFREGLQQWAASKQLNAFIDEHQPDVLAAHWSSHAADLGCRIKAQRGLPLFIRIHGGDLYRSPSPSLPRLAACADVVCPVSPFLARLLRGERPVEHLPDVPHVEVNEDTLRVVPNAIPDNAIVDEPVAQETDTITMTTIGRIDPEKRHADLVEALGRLAPEHPSLRLKIIGGGQLEDDVRAKAEELGVADRLTITGSQPWHKVIEHVREAQIYAHASDVEGCSLAILEGQGQGLPLILSLTGAAEQCVDEGVNGHIYQAGDIDALCAAISSVLSKSQNERVAMGRASLDIVRRRFREDVVFAKIASLLEAARDGKALPETS